MIYVTGDCHGEWTRFSTQKFPEQKEMTKEDFVIVCGDFGYWTPSKEQEYWMDWLEKKPFTTLFVDGNHENFDGLYQYAPKLWRGGTVHKIRETVLHLMRGQVFELDGKRFFTFGGARSHDIQGGVLDPEDPEFQRKRRAAERRNLFYRIDHQSWWREEMPSREEMEEGRRNLERHGWQVDYVISHCCRTCTQELLTDGRLEADELTEYFTEIYEKLKLRQWFFGHYHMDGKVTGKETVLYEKICRIKYDDSARN